METIRKDLATLAGVPAFDARHPELKPDAIAIAGPFESSEKAAHRVLEWAFKQPGGSFMVHLNGTYTAIKSRGRQFKVRCKNVKKHKCQFKLVYEQADDDRYHLQNANLSHGDGCRKPDATPAENLAAGTFRVPPELLETGVQMKAANMSTAVVNSFMLHQAGLAGLDVTWTWHHLDRALARELEKLPGGVPGRGHDAAGVLEWLHERQLNHGLFSSYTTDEEARLNRLYYVVDGAAETWKRASGFSIALFDTTHSTNQYDMRLGCFTTRNEDGRTILLAVSLVKNEDARSFAWVFGKFKESFASEPDVLLTDGDPAMAAAAKSVFPGTRHLLCTWHISQNLLTHALKLFPTVGGGGARPDQNEPKRKAFRHAYMDIMNHGGPGLEEPDAYFDKQWEVLLAKARVDGALACPASVDVDSTAVYDAAYESAAEELDDALEDGDVAIKVHKRRGRPRKPPAEQVWEWLATQKAVKEKWARVYTRETQSRGNFTSNTAESWHALLKRHLGNTKKLLPLVTHLDAQRKVMDGNGAVKRSVRIRDHAVQAGQHPPLLESVRSSVSPGAFDYLLKEYQEARPLRAARAESTAPTGPARYHVHTGALNKERAVVATKRTCSARCEWNHGLPCRHILRVYVAENLDELDDELIHPFWRERTGGSEDDSEDDEVYHDAPEADGWEAGEVTENPADAGPRVPPKTDRWRCIATACKALCDVGKRSKNAYLDVMDAVERVHRELDRKHSKPAERADKGGVDPVTGKIVLNPSQPKHGKGKRGTKRAKGALGA
jgi:hypothetical protein